jgi:hypothetical protein
MVVSYVLHGTVQTVMDPAAGSTNAGSKDATGITRRWIMPNHSLQLDRMFVRPPPARLHMLTRQINRRF